MNRWTKVGLGTLLALALAGPGVAAASSTTSAAAQPMAATQAAPPPPPDPDALGAQSAAGNQGAVYVSVAPCRIVDTRSGTGTNGTPFSSLATRTYYVGGTFGFAPQGGHSGGCGIPVGATAITATLTAVNPSHSGYLRAWPNGQSEPTATLVNYGTFSTGSGATVPINQSSAYALKVRNYGGPTDVVIDVTGYYAKQIYGSFDNTGAVYNGNGTLAYYSHSSTGYYVLHANRDLTGCTPIASAYYSGYIATPSVSGEYVYVYLNNPYAGAVDYYFHVAVFC